MIVVSDTTPLNYLILIRVEHVLPALYGSVLVPSQVIQELLAPKAPDLVRKWANKLPDWVHVHESDESRFPILYRGEAAALALAIDTKATALLADDMEARFAAQAVGISVVGTVGVIAAAHRLSLIDFDTTIQALRASTFHVHDSVITAVRNSLQ